MSTSGMATFAFFNEGERDEIKNYLTGHYISINEAIWRNFWLETHQRYPAVVNLAVHLENRQRVYFSEDTAHNLVQTPPESTLTDFFKLCQQDVFEKSLMYIEVPTYYTWTKQKSWFQRKHGKTVQGHEVKALDGNGCVYTVHPNNMECFYL